MGEVAFEKRGPRAWDNFETLSLRPLHEGGLARLLVHSIGDSTAAQRLPRVREFLSVCKRQGLTFTHIKDLDEALAQYFDWMCYTGRLLPGHGSLLYFGVLCLMPEVKGHLHLASRSLKSWRKLTVTIEGGPMCEEAIFALACYMLAKSLFPEAAWILVRYDCYARGQDMKSLREQDVAWDGSNQGAVLRRGPIADLLLGLKENTIKGELMLPFTQAHLREHWHRACAALGLGFAGPPHVLRHSGPSEELARGRTSLEAARRRGRWKAMASVQRYTKTFALTKFRARMPQAVLAIGKKAILDLRTALINALGQATSDQARLKQILTLSLRRARAHDSLREDPQTVTARRSTSPRRTTPRDVILAANDSDVDSDAWCTE